MKRKSKFMIVIATFAFSILTLGMGRYAMNTETKLASAAPVSVSPYCLTYGVTTTDEGRIDGCPDNFKVYMKTPDSSGSRIIHNDHQLNWSAYCVVIEPIEVTEHLTLQLYKDSTLYRSLALPNQGEINVNLGMLPSGNYMLRYECYYKKGVLAKKENFTYEYRFGVDATAPTYNVSAATGGGYYSNVDMYYSAHDTNFSHIRYRHGTQQAYSTSYGSSFSVKATEENNGQWCFYAVDTLGNESQAVYRYVDTIAPIGKLTSKSGAMLINGGATDEEFVYSAKDETSSVRLEYKTPNASTWASYAQSSAVLGEDGWYAFRSTDTAGNVSEEFRIFYDRSVPTAQLFVDGTPVASGTYTNGQYVSFTSDAICYVKKPGEEEFSAYVSGTEFYHEGRYEFYAETLAGASSGVHVIIVDRSPKMVEAVKTNDGMPWDDVKLSWEAIDVNTNAPITKITVNGHNCEFGSTIYTLENQVYQVVIYDAAGNESATCFQGAMIDIPTITLQKVYWRVQDYLSGEVYAFQDYENALEYAKREESALFESKTWNTETWDQGIPMDTKDSVNAKNGVYYIYKSEDKPDTRMAYFTAERLDEVARLYAAKNVQAYYYWEGIPEECLDGNLDAYRGMNKITATQISLRDGLIYTLDGEALQGLTITTPGAHTLLIEDGYGNSVEYEIYILDSAPTLQYALGENAPTNAEFDRTYYFDGKVVLSIPFEGDEFSMFMVYDENGEVLGYFDITNACVIEKSGVYTAKAVNHYGFTEEFTFVVSMYAPRIVFSENAGEKVLDIGITQSEDKQANITYIEITKSKDGGQTWSTLTQDDYGTLITMDTLEYHFRTSGTYRVMVIDEFRTGIDAITQTIVYTQPIPEGVLTGVVNGGYTNKAVAFTWEDAAIVNLTKDGIDMAYTSGQELTENGVYVLTFSNHDGYKQVYKFAIDTIAPTLRINGVKNGGKTTGEVILFNPSETVNIAVSKGGEVIEYALGETLNEAGRYEITVADECGNVSVYTFEIVREENELIPIVIAIICLTFIGVSIIFILKRSGRI